MRFLPVEGAQVSAQKTGANLGHMLVPLPDLRNPGSWFIQKKGCDGCGNVAITSVSGASEEVFYWSSAKAMQES
jgi:hypothetical protein